MDGDHVTYIIAKFKNSKRLHNVTDVFELSRFYLKGSTLKFHLYIPYYELNHYFPINFDNVIVLIPLPLIILLTNQPMEMPVIM